MNFFKCLLAIAIIAFSSQSYAYYCSTSAGNGYVNIGDTPAQVQQACGVPSFTDKNKMHDEKTTAIQYWTYENAFITNTVGLESGGARQSVSRSGPTTTVEIQNGQITNIMQDSNSDASNDCFSRGSIKVGDSSDQLLASCGQPSSSTTQPKTVQGPEKDVETWHYSRGNYASPLVFEFEDGRLKNIKE